MSSDLDEAVKLGLSPSPTLFSSLLATFRQTLPMQCRTAPSSSRLTPVQRELLSPRRFLKVQKLNLMAWAPGFCHWLISGSTTKAKRKEKTTWSENWEKDSSSKENLAIIIERGN